MNYKKLGNTNLKVSSICLGTMTWGNQNTQKEALEQMDYALDQGVNFFDTAELYPVPMDAKYRGKTSQFIGEWFLKTKKRDKIILADKVAGGSPMNWMRPAGVEKTSLSKKQIEFAIDRSLKDLKTDYIDLYQVHWPDRPSGPFSGKLEYEHKDTDNFVNIDETLDALNNLEKAGKVKHIGISNETAWGTNEYLKLAEKKNFTKIVSIQNAYNFLNRAFEVGLSEIAIREKVGLLAYSPLASGYLSGKYRNGAMPKDSRMDLFLFDFELLTANGSLIHQATLRLREDGDAANKVCIRGRTSGNSNCRRLCAEFIVATFKTAESRSIFKENELAVRLSTRLKTEG